MKLIQTKTLFFGSLWKVVDTANPSFFTGGMGEMKKVMGFIEDIEESLGAFAVKVKELGERTTKMMQRPLEERQSEVNEINAEFDKLFDVAREEDFEIEMEDDHFNTFFNIFNTLDKRQANLPFISWKELVQFEKDLNATNGNVTQHKKELEEQPK